MSADAPVEIPLEISVDNAPIQRSLSDVRGLLFALNSVKNLAADVTAMAQAPTLSNAFWLALQAKSTARRMGNIPGQIEEGLGAVSGFADSILGFAMINPYAAVAVGVAVGGTVVAGIAAYEINKQNEFNRWMDQQRKTAKQQGLEP